MIGAKSLRLGGLQIFARDKCFLKTKKSKNLICFPCHINSKMFWCIEKQCHLKNQNIYVSDTFEMSDELLNIILNSNLTRIYQNNKEIIKFSALWFNSFEGNELVTSLYNEWNEIKGGIIE